MREERVLFAVAMTAPLSLFSKCHSMASLAREAIIMDDQWEKLDFGLFEHMAQCTGRLTDDDLGALLMCIDARNTLKSLELTLCDHITGSGLEPLRGTTALERIDLSLGYNDNNDASSSSISASVVIPILESIVEKEGNSLRHIQFPKKWRTERGSFMDQFLAKYNKVLRGSCIPCS
ncbi:hypothetical protein ACHAXR_007306, partial [Thalassiosira sp. AJA248-18]